MIAHLWTAGLERTGQAAGIGSRRACRPAVLIVGVPARACGLSWADRAGAEPADPAPATSSGNQVEVPLDAQ